MDFSESYRYSGPTPLYSPNGKYVAIVVEYRLAIRDADTLKVVQLYSCLDKIHQIEWSSDSTYILCALHSRAIVQVWSVHEPEWTCKIDEGPAGVSHARWTPDGRSILIVADFNVRSTMWSLATKNCTYLKGPKSGDKAVAFSPDGQQMALIERFDCKDLLCFYDCSDWALNLQLQADTSDAAGVLWAPDSRCLVVWDSVLAYRVVVYTPTGECLAAFSPYSEALGVRSVCWSPGGQFLSLGSYDQVARLLNHVTWTPLMECEHPPVVSTPPSTVVYKEVEEVLTAEGAEGVRETRSKYVICELPAPVPWVKPPADKPNPKIGVAQLHWSPDGQFLVTLNENMPVAVWVWDLTQMQLSAVLLHSQPIKAVAWAPDGISLAVCTGSTRVYLWSPAGASIVHIPLQSFQAHHLKWNTGSKAFLLGDRDAMCCAYLV